MGKVQDITGNKFGKLTALKIVGYKNHSMMWLCNCDCGGTRVVATKDLNYSEVKSCGCLKKLGNRKIIAGAAAFNRLFGRYKRQAKKRNLTFELSEEVFRSLTQQNCKYCKIEPRHKVGEDRLHGDYIHNGIDRVDSSIGYIISNCVPCCGICNWAKRGLKLEDFLAWIERFKETKT